MTGTRAMPSLGDSARDAALAATVRELEALPVVRAVVSVMRVEGEEE